MIMVIIKRLLTFFLLTIFAFTSCSNPFFNNLPNKADVYKLEVGKGMPYYVYLDSEYNPILEEISINDPDPGRTALLVHDNPLAEDVFVLAETMPYGIVTQIINTDLNYKISMYFENNNFPSSFIIETNDATYKAFLSSYNEEKQCYSIFFQDNGEYISYDNVIMNKSILSYHTKDISLSENQNARIQSMYTALGLYASLYNIFEIETNTDIYFFLDFLRCDLAKIFFCISIAAFVVACILSPPIIIGSVAIIIPGTGGIASLVSLGISLGFGFATYMAEELHDTHYFEHNTPPILDKVIVSILINGEKMINDYYIININEEIEIEIITPTVFEDYNIPYLFYDPVTDSIENILNHGIYIFEVNNIDIKYKFGNLLQGNNNLKITRNSYMGAIEGGKIHFILLFGNIKTVVNDQEIYEKFDHVAEDTYYYPIKIKTNN